MYSAIFEILRKEGVLDPVTVELLKHLNPLSSEGISWLDCIALISYQQGHTAIYREESLLLDHIKKIFLSHKHSESILSIEDSLHIFEAVIQEISSPKFQDRYFVENNLIELPFVKSSEASLVSDLFRIASSSPREVFSDPFSSDIAKKIIQTLHQRQLEAVTTALRFPFSIIHGGPGTGKTYTAGVLVLLLIEQFRKKFQEPYRILVTAPTGKAVFTLKASIEKNLHFFQKHFQEAFQESLGDFLSSVSIESMTIHSFLIEQKRSENDIGYHTIIADESSMIDLQLMAQFFKGIHTGTRLILMGDPNQLPPIQPGRPFLDIIEAIPKLSKDESLYETKLSLCLRSDLTSIVNLSSAVLEGSVDRCFEILEKQEEGVDYISLDDMDESSLTLSSPCFQKVSDRITRDWGKSDTLSIEDAKGSALGMKILSPVRDGFGIFSVTGMNQAISEQLQKKRTKNQRTVAPILITKNRHSFECMNGDVGVLEKEEKSSFKAPISWLHIPHSRYSPFPASLCPEYEYAYAMTIHKSQGSEFQDVVILLPENGPLLSRTLLYTAITRAKKSVTIIAKRASLQRAILEESPRMSSLGHKISQRLS